MRVVFMGMHETANIVGFILQQQSITAGKKKKKESFNISAEITETIHCN